MGVKIKPQSGFSLIEMLVVVAIITVITAVVLSSNSKFGGVIQLETVAYDIALTARQVQVYGTAVRRADLAGVSSFVSAYGIHFESTTPTNFILFADALGTPNSIYDLGEALQTSTIGRGYYVQQLCGSSGTETCGLKSLDVSYVRPEPDATIIGVLPDDTVVSYQQARAVIASPRGDVLSIWFDNNGLISVHN